LDGEQADTLEPRMKPKITNRITYLTVQTSRDPKKIEYGITILIKDSNNNEYTFRSAKVYKYDESGKAHFDLEVLQDQDI